MLARVEILASNRQFFNPFVIEGDRHDLWNMIELQRAIGGDNENAPTMRNMLRAIAGEIRTNAANYVRSGRALATEKEKKKRINEFSALSMELERIAGEGNLAAIVGQYNTVNVVLAQVRALGLYPKDALVSGLAQACHAALLPAPGEA